MKRAGKRTSHPTIYPPKHKVTKGRGTTLSRTQDKAVLSLSGRVIKKVQYMSSEIDLFLEYMISRDYPVLRGTPAEEQEIDKFETRYSVKLPFDIREYFLKINGMRYVGSSIPRLHSLSEWHRLVDMDFFEEIYKEHGKQLINAVDKYFYFGTSPGAWIIQLNVSHDDKTPVYLLWDRAILIANSLSDFLNKYRTLNGRSVLPPGITLG